MCRITGAPDGRPFAVLALKNSPTGFVKRNRRANGYFLRSNGVTVTVQKRESARWWALMSYSLSKTEGLEVSSALPPGAPEFNSTLGSNTFGRDPNSLTNARGRLGCRKFKHGAELMNGRSEGLRNRLAVMSTCWSLDRGVCCPIVSGCEKLDRGRLKDLTRVAQRLRREAK
jgi:hypothetical protein